MDYSISVWRQASADEQGYFQTFVYASEDGQETVAAVLAALNERSPLVDQEGVPASPIAWEHSCLQKKCGACAMVINNQPRLACDARLAEYRQRRIEVTPLRKFPLVKDLMVDRTILYENLKAMKLWLKGDSQLSDRDYLMAYTASECIQCGCCLEVCPNFYAGGEFFGMSSVPLTTRLLVEDSGMSQKEFVAAYKKHVYEGCGKSLSCRNICPRHIALDQLLVKNNAFALWRWKGRRK